MNRNMILRIAIVAKLALAILICSYFWQSTTLEEIRQIPMQILILCVAYIGLQMFTRRFSGTQNWWDWIYYVGLLSIMIPVSIADKKNEILYHSITDYGTLLLIIPVLIDGWYIISSKPSEK